MAPPSFSQLEYLNLTKFQQAARHLHNILSIEAPDCFRQHIHSGQIMTHLRVLESEHQSLLDQIEQLKDKSSLTSIGPSKRPLAALPDLCLLALFRELPLADQIAVRHACHRWHRLATEVTHSRRRLTLLVNHRRIDQLEDWIDYPRYYDNSRGGSVVRAKTKVLSLLRAEDGRPLYPAQRYTAWNTLQFGSLSKEAVSLIGGTFPGIKELQLAVNSAEVFNIEHLVSLLGHWQSQLTSLFLFNGIENSPGDKASNPTLLSAVNSLSALKCLTLYAYQVNYNTFNLSIIGQLEELNLHFHQAPSSSRIPAMLSKYGDGNKALARISFECRHAVLMEMENFTPLSAHLRSCFTQLHCYGLDPLFPVPDLFMHFPNITTLHLEYPNIYRNAPRIDLSMITLLTQLIHLRLILDFRFIRPEHPPYLLQVQVKSVRVLELVLIMDTHEQLPPMNIAWTFPNVEAIHVAFSDTVFWSKCSHCEVEFFPDHTRQQHSNPAQVQHCLRQLLAPLKRDCTKLRAILHDREKVFGTADELLAH